MEQINRDSKFCIAVEKAIKIMVILILIHYLKWKAAGKMYSQKNYLIIVTEPPIIDLPFLGLMK